MNKKAFTLIEMLIVVIVIMVLASYAIFAYLDTIREGEAKASKSKLEVIHAGYEKYNMEYPNYPLKEAQAFTNTIPSSCSPKNNSTQAPEMLVTCGYVPKTDFNTEKFQYFLGSAGCSISTTGGKGPAYMRPKQGTDGPTGKFSYESNYCAGIDIHNGGRAKDGTFS